MSFPAAVRGSGTSIGFPDVCNTPAGTATVPTPYTNTGSHSMAQNASESVKIIGMSALTTASTLSATQGDEAGTAMGTTSGTVSSTGTFTSGSPTVYIDGIPAVRLTSSTTGNNMNNSVGSVTVPGAATVLFGYAATSAAGEALPIERAVDTDEILALFDRVERGGVGSRDDGPDDPALEGEAHGDVALFTVRRFTTDAARRFWNVYARLGRPRQGGLAIDLRACAGGDLHAAIELAAAFLPEGARVLAVRDEDGDEEVFRAPRDGWVGEPVTLLVGRETKSAGEAFVMALASNGRATVVGGPTFGKHTAQAIVTTRDGARLQTTVSFG